MREYDKHDDLNDRAGSHGKCRREPVDVFECSQLYNSGSECDEQYKRKLGHIRSGTFTNGTTLTPTYTRAEQISWRECNADLNLSR